MIDKAKAIVYDADIIIHFISGDKLLDLFKIFPNENFLLDKVYDELSKHSKTKETIDNLISLEVIKIVSFSSNLVIIKEYAHLRSPLMNKGDGESACMAYCLHTKNVIASSNLKDIKKYCKLHDIEYLTTMGFVKYAYTNSLWPFQDCEQFVEKLILKKHKIPCKSFKEYADSNGLPIFK